MDAQNPKRSRIHVSSSIRNPKRSRKDVSSSIRNHNSPPSTTPKENPKQLASIISSLLLFPESSRLSLTSPSIDSVLNKALASVSNDVPVQDRLVNSSFELQSVILESTKRCIRQLASVHSSNSWFLPQDLTVKVFSMLDTKSLIQAMACCTMFRQCAMEPSSYSHINLTTSAKTVKDKDVLTMISRAGKELRFLELGHIVPLDESDKPKLKNACLDKSDDKLFLDGSECLVPLSSNNGFIGFGPCDHMLKSLTTKCLFIEKLFFEIYDFPAKSRKESPALVKFLTKIIPNLTSLSLIGFRLKDTTLETLTASSRKLKHLDLSRNTTIKGHFLSDPGSSFHDGPLETLILRNCSSLEEKEVSQFLDLVCTGDFRYIRHIDVSNNRGMVSDGGKPTYNPKFPKKKLEKKRSNVKLVAEYPWLERPIKISGVTNGSVKAVKIKFPSNSSDDEG